MKKRIIKSMVWSVALYGAETWTLRKEDIRKIEAFECGFGGKWRG